MFCAKNYEPLQLQISNICHVNKIFRLVCHLCTVSIYKLDRLGVCVVFVFQSCTEPSGNNLATIAEEMPHW